MLQNPVLRTAPLTRTAFVIICLACSALFTGCKPEKEKNNSAPEQFSVIHPVIADTVFTKEYVAEIQSVQNVELRARVKGFIEKIHVDEGKYVHEGQILFTLSSKEFQEDLLKANAQLKSSQADAKVAEVELNRTKTLVVKNIISKTELDMAQAKYDAIEAKIEDAKSAISIAKLKVSFAQVRAPFSGMINRIPNKIGSIVEEGALLTTISNNKEVFAYFNVSEKEYLDFLNNNELEKKEVSLLMANNQLFIEKGIIETSESEINRSTGNIAFRARFNNRELLLKHGASGKILINLHLKNAMIIPQKSTFEVQEMTNVYIVDANNTVQVKSFVPKLRLPQMYVVESGLSADDRIIYEGLQLVKEGDKIAPQLITTK